MSDSLWPHQWYSPWNSPGRNTGVGTLSLLQGIFPTQGWNPSLPHYRRILYQLSHKGSPLNFWKSKLEMQSLWWFLKSSSLISPQGSYAFWSHYVSLSNVVSHSWTFSAQCGLGYIIKGSKVKAGMSFLFDSFLYSSHQQNCFAVNKMLTKIIFEWKN